MRQRRPRKRGRPPKSQSDNDSQNNNNKNNKIIMDDYDDDSNQSSSTTTNTSRSSINNNNSKYQTRSSRRSSTRLNNNSIVESRKKRNNNSRKRKKANTDDELCDDDDDDDDEEYYQRPIQQRDYDDDILDSDNDNNNEDDENNDDDDDDDDDNDNEIDEFEEEEELEEETEDENDDEISKRRKRPSREKAPVYLDDQELPELILPSSSEDLLISGNELIRSLSIYEILRHFSNTLRLSPFRFEDFCVSLLIDEQTYLLSEIHIQLLKALIREDDLMGTQHGPQDIRDSINIYLYLCDHVTWPEVLKIYLSSDYKKNKSIMDKCLNDSYPFTSLDKKLILLAHLCDDFLNTQVVRDAINLEGKFDHDEYCRSCHKNGEMLMCDTCPAVFHLSCLDPPLKQVPEHEWYCPICKQNQVTGVTDCVNEYERQMQRQEPIGWDRHGRQYWFLARRIIVEDVKSDKVWYYTTRLQFDQLFECLDDEQYESDLCKTLLELRDDIYRQMIITEKLTKIAKGSRKSYLEVVNEEIYLKKSTKLKLEETESDSNQTIINEKLAELEMKLSVDDEDLRGGGMQTRLKTGTLPQRFTFQMNPLRNQSSLYNTIQAFRDEDTVIIVNDENNKTLTRTQRRALTLTYFQINLFNLGFEGNYRNYQNIYSLIPMALSRNQTLDDRDRRRHLSHKFSLTPISELKWATYNQVITATPVTTAHGPKPMLINTLRQAILQLELNFSNPFMHPNWKKHRENWIKAVKFCSEPKDFGLALSVLESVMKPVLFNNAWNDILGFTVLQRSTQSERDELKKKEKKSGRPPINANVNYDLNELASNMLDPNDTTSSSKFSPNGTLGVKLINGKLRHQIWKQKGEEYRLSGIGGWYWLNKIINPYKIIKCDLEKNLSTTNNIPDNSDNNDDNNNNGDDKINQSNTNNNNDDDEEKFDENFIVNISECLSKKNLSERKKYYPKIFKESKLDIILSLRMSQLKLERKNNNNDIVDEKKNIEIIENKKSTSSFNCCCYANSCDSNSNCYSPLCLYLSKNSNQINGIDDNNDNDDEKKSKLIFKDLTSLVELKKIITIDGVEQFAKKVVSFISKGQLPLSTRFNNGKFKSILIPLNYELRQLGRSGGQYEISGFNYNAKINPTLWPYGLTPRPSFRMTWLYRVYNLPTLHCVALQIRVLWASIRWDDLAQKPPISGTNTITTDIDVQTIEILKRTDLPPFGLRSQYLIRKITVPIDVPIYRSRETSTPNRSGLRERRRAESPQNKGPRMDENWVREEELELWEIKQFYDKQLQLARQKAIQEQRQKELEMKRKLQQTGTLHNKTSHQIDTVRIVNGGNINLTTTPTKALTAKFSTLITNRTPIKTNVLNTQSTSHPTIATINTVPYGSTIHTSNGQMIRLQTPTGTKPSPQLYIRPGNNIQLLTSTANQTTPNRTQTYIVRTPINTISGSNSTPNSSRPIIISSALNASPLFRTVNAINPNIRHSIPIIATNCPKKISTSTPVNAILTTNTIKTVASTTTATTITSSTTSTTNVPSSLSTTVTTLSSSSSSSSSTTTTPTAIPISTINVGGNNSKNIACIPIKLSDGRTQYIPISSISSGINNNQTVQINLNSNNQIRFVTGKPIITNINNNNNTSTNSSSLSSSTTTPGLINIATNSGGDHHQSKAIFVTRTINTNTINNNNNTILPITTTTTASSTTATSTITPFNTFVLTNANNQKVIFQTTNPNNNTNNIINTIGSKIVHIGNNSNINNNNNQTISSSIVNKNPIIIRNNNHPNVVTTAQQTDPIPASTLNKAINISNDLNSNNNNNNNKEIINDNKKDNDDNDDDYGKDFVVTSEMTQDIVRKALMNPNVAPEIAQKLLALQKHHQEQSDSPNYYQNINNNLHSNHLLSSSSSSSLNNRNDDLSNYHHRTNHRSSSRSSSRYSKSKYDNDGDYIYEYPQADKHSKLSRMLRDENENVETICENIVNHLIEKIEKIERTIKQKELNAERKHKKAIQLKIKYRQNHIEAIRRNILRRKSVFNQHIKCMVDREIDEKLKIAQQKISIPNNNKLKSSTNNDNNVNDNNKTTISGVKHKLDETNNNINNKSNSNLTKTNSLESETPRPSKRQRLTNSSNTKSPTTIATTNSNDTSSHNSINVNNNIGKNHPNHSNQRKSPKNKNSTTTTTTYCICNRTDDKSMMIACDDCGSWYHIKCIGIDKQEADDLEQYFCSNCQERNPKSSNNNSSKKFNSNTKSNSRSTPNVQKKSGPGRKTKHHNRINNNITNNNNNNKRSQIDENNDNVNDDEENGEYYCICKEKYESDKFYISCDQCYDWFHGRCVGITSIRSEQIDKYYCPNCQGEESRSYKIIQPLVDVDYQRMEKIIKSLKSHRSAWPFLKPVDGKQVPDYYTIIKEPMDLSQISNYINGRIYKRLTEFIYDMYKMFDNCRYYNESSSQYCFLANVLEEFFDRKLRELYTYY